MDFLFKNFILFTIKAENRIHSCHQNPTLCLSMHNGWQESCHPPYAAATTGKRLRDYA